MSRVDERELRSAAARLAEHLEARWLAGERSPVDQAREVLRLAVVGRRKDVLERRFAPMAWGLINAARFGDARRLALEVLPVLDEARVHHALARSCKELGESGEAQGAYREALRRLEAGAAAEAPPGPLTHDLAGVLCEMAGLDRLAGRREEAVRRLERAHDLATRVLRDEELEGFVLHEIAVLEMDDGAWRSAQPRLERALEIERRGGDVRGIGRTLHALAQCARHSGQSDSARSLFEQALEFKKKSGDRDGEAVTLHDLALLTSDPEVARSMHQRSLEIGRQVGDARGVAANLRALAGHELRQGRPDEAAHLAEESLRLARALGEPATQAGALHELASAQWRRNEIDAARRGVDEAVSLAEAAGDRRVSFDLALRWGEMEAGRTDGGDRASRLLDRAVAMGNAMRDAGRHAEATRMRARLADLRGTPMAREQLAAAARLAAGAGDWDELVQCCVELAVHDPAQGAAWTAQALWLIAALVRGRLHAFGLVPTLQVIASLAPKAPADAELHAGLAALAFALTPQQFMGQLGTEEGRALHDALLAAAARCGISVQDLEHWMNEQVLPRSGALQAPLLDRVEALVPAEMWLVDRAPLRAAGASGGRP